MLYTVFIKLQPYNADQLTVFSIFEYEMDADNVVNLVYKILEIMDCYFVICTVMFN